MASIQDISNSIRSQIYSLGKAAVNALFPMDCEFYMIGLELVNSKGLPVDYLAFPIMPSQIKESKPEKTSIIETAGGVVSITSPTFKPRDITISGNFGRGFSMNAGAAMSFVALRYSTITGVYHKEDMQANNYAARATHTSPNPFIKTGYGFIKVLEAILDKAQGVDERGLPMRLHFYNPAFGNNYIIDPIACEFHQDKQSSNMIWNYSLTLKASAPLSLAKGDIGSAIGSAMAAQFSTINDSILRSETGIKL